VPVYHLHVSISANQSAVISHPDHAQLLSGTAHTNFSPYLTACNYCRLFQSRKKLCTCSVDRRNAAPVFPMVQLERPRQLKLTADASSFNHMPLPVATNRPFTYEVVNGFPKMTCAIRKTFTCSPIFPPASSIIQGGRKRNLGRKERPLKNTTILYSLELSGKNGGITPQRMTRGSVRCPLGARCQPLEEGTSAW
jgi:hypothetical protein